MKYQYVPYCWPLWISAFITLFLGAFTMVKRRSAKGAVSFIISMFIVSIWSLSNALEMLGADLSTKLFWANVQYFAYCYSPVTLLALCMEYTGFISWIKSKKILTLCIIPTIVIALVWTDSSHGLIRSNMHLGFNGLFPVIVKEYGPAFYVHAIYSYLLDFFAWALLVNAAYFKNSFYRKQAFSLLIGLSLIIFPNLIYVFNLIPSYRFDITPVFFGPAGLITAWGLFRYKLFEIVPVAWAKVLQVMDTGAIIVDMQGRILDANPAFEKIAGFNGSDIMAKPVAEVCGNIPELVEACMDNNTVHSEFSICSGNVKKTYEAIFSPLSMDQKITICRLALIHDITEKKQIQEILLKQQWQLAVNEEREKMARDLHDNLGQVLGFINLQAQGIRQELKNSGVDTVTNRLNRLVDATQSAHTELREYIRSIRDPAYCEKDFLTALEKDIAYFETQTSLTVDRNIPVEFNGERIKPTIQIQLLSVVKEALNNIRKHAEAKRVKIALSFEKEAVCVMIQDDGKGFRIMLGQNPVKTKFGLDIMRERAEEIGGTLKIESAPGEGCRIVLSVPIENGGNSSETNACG